MGLYGSLDANITTQVPAFAEAMKGAGKRFEPVVYEGAQHAFFNDTRPAYHGGAARDALARVLSFFRAELATWRAARRGPLLGLLPRWSSRAPRPSEVWEPAIAPDAAAATTAVGAEDARAETAPARTASAPAPAGLVEAASG